MEKVGKNQMRVGVTIVAVAVVLRRRIPAIVVASGKRSMSSNSNSSFITIKEMVSVEREIKKSKFIAIAGPISTEQSAQNFLAEVGDPRATHNCWAYKIGDQNQRCSDDGEPSGTAGKPIQSAILSSGLDRVMVVVIRYFGGIKLGTGGLVRAYAGVTSDCLKTASTCLVKSKVIIFVFLGFFFGF